MGSLRVSGFLNELPLKGMEFFLYKKKMVFSTYEGDVEHMKRGNF